MALIGRMIGGPGAVAALGAAGRELAALLAPQGTRGQQPSAEAQRAALDQHGAEFAHPRLGWFDVLVNGLNRLPRPMLALGTLGLFVYAMADPAGFAERMQGLAFVPEPLWWLLGAIVAFYFGARELHYIRHRAPAAPAAPETPDAAPGSADDLVPPMRPGANPALDAWRLGPDDR